MRHTNDRQLHAIQQPLFLYYCNVYLILYLAILDLICNLLIPSLVLRCEPTRTALFVRMTAHLSIMRPSPYAIPSSRIPSMQYGHRAAPGHQHSGAPFSVAPTSTFYPSTFQSHPMIVQGSLGSHVRKIGFVNGSTFYACISHFTGFFRRAASTGGTHTLPPSQQRELAY